LADLSLDKEMLKAVIEKRVELVERRAEVHWLWNHVLVSQRRICGLMGVAELRALLRHPWNENGRICESMRTSSSGCCCGGDRIVEQTT
jgi:hypothetical protein